jgi:hypothetical protein
MGCCDVAEDVVPDSPGAELVAGFGDGDAPGCVPGAGSIRPGFSFFA